MTSNLILALPPGHPLLNANDRRNRYAQAKITKEIRTWVHDRVRGLDQFPGTVKIIATYYPGTRHRHDPGNIFPSVKAAVDGLVPIVIPDDSSKYVTSLEMIVASTVIKGSQLVIEVVSNE